jgi:hypothetical protein
VLGDFGWSLWFTNEVDGCRSYNITAAHAGAVLKSGRGDAWDDVLLAAITDLYRLSAEELAG